jgi:RNA polymerase sigma-70 factor (ECF subfamily)
LFLPRVPDGRRARFAAAPDLEAALAGLVAGGRDAWPEIRVDGAAFLGFLGCTLPEEAAADLGALRAGELYLVCAYVLGAPGAGAALETHYMPRVRAALARLGTPAALVADIQQELRERLVAMAAPDDDRRGYAGRGDLAAWLCVSAVREAGKRRERGKRERPLGEAEAALLVSPERDPEMAHLRATYKEEFQSAFARALAALTSRERNLLHYHFVERRTIDQIGALYGVHRATAARWINEAREALCLRTRDILAERVSLSQEGFHRLLGLIESQVDVGAALGLA